MIFSVAFRGILYFCTLFHSPCSVRKITLLTGIKDRSGIATIFNIAIDVYTKHIKASDTLKFEKCWLGTLFSGNVTDRRHLLTLNRKLTQIVATVVTRVPSSDQRVLPPENQFVPYQTFTTIFTLLLFLPTELT